MPNMILAFILFFAAFTASAGEVIIFDVRKPLAMKNGEKTHQDYYINAGSESGLKAGMVVNVVRRTSIYDTYQNKSLNDLVVPVGRIKIIHVQSGLSVARVDRIFKRDGLPTLDVMGVMQGDRLDMSSAKMVKRKTASVKKKKSAPVYGPVYRPSHANFASKAPEGPGASVPTRQ